mmetsp:Transcript_35935/g.55205  ORF Transcript_35935/g.55205 Transcript_35935/m.55205 type:complete len:228 (+) Transcript_35935:1531-2214(+)
MPIPITKNFTIYTETSQNKKVVKDMIRRFTEKTSTFEFIVKFNIKVERTNESSISLGNGIPGELLDQKERRRYVRKEIMAYQKQDIFLHSIEQVDKNLFGFLLDFFTKANQLLNIIYQDNYDDYKDAERKQQGMSKAQSVDFRKKNFVREQEPFMDKLKFIEMQLNKKEMLLEKAKLVCVKLDKAFVIIPYTVSKIELRMRNILMNNKKILDGLSHFMNFYLINKQF